MLAQLGRQITRINVSSFHKTPVLYRIYRQASTAKTIPELVIKRPDELLCYQQPDIVIKKINSLELDWQEKAFITNIGSRPDNFEFIKLINFRENKTHIKKPPSVLVPENIISLPSHRKQIVKQLIQADLDETQTELNTIRKFTTEYSNIINRLQKLTLGSIAVGISTFVLASLSYDTTSNLVLMGLLTSSGLGFSVTGLYMITGKITNNRFDLLNNNSGELINKYEKKVEKLDKVLAKLKKDSD